MEIPIKVKDDIETSINALLAKFRFNINKIILFGSFATGKYQPDSDIDIMVVLNELPDIKHRRLYKQAIDLENIDLLFCSKNQLSNDNLVFKRVNEKGLVLYEQL
ncbi:MAG: nucleotidyltransferase domain-containing protein [Spirochaetaceae bacterium]|nr:nucleotidyltransferase domain-containing protein [Spirochaetaceae bacterium]